MKKLHFFILAWCVGCFFQGCEKNNSSGTANGPAGKKLHLAFVTNTKNDFWTSVRHGCNSAAQNLGNVDVEFHYFTGTAADEQNKMVSDLVAQGVDGIAI